MINKKLSCALFALTLGVSVCTFGGTAAAASKSGCTVTSIMFDGSRMLTTCANDGSTSYYGFLSVPGCAVQSLDTLKIWLSMLQSALLSGRTADFFFQPPSSTCGVPSLIAVIMK